MRRPTWHLFLHPIPEGDPPAESVRPDGVRRLLPTAEQLRVPFDRTFEEVVHGLEQLPAAWCEPDGAFGWYPCPDGTEELAGTIHCLDHRVMTVEMHMGLSRSSWQRALSAVSGGRNVMIQAVEEGIFLTPAAFEGLAFGEPVSRED